MTHQEFAWFAFLFLIVFFAGVAARLSVNLNLNMTLFTPIFFFFFMVVSYFYPRIFQDFQRLMSIHDAAGIALIIVIGIYVFRFIIIKLE